MGLTIGPQGENLRRVAAATPAAAMAAGLLYLLGKDAAFADVDSWPRAGGHPSNTTTSEDFSQTLDPVNLVFFFQGYADTVNQKLNDGTVTDPRWPSCNKGSKQWLWIDDSMHDGVQGDNSRWVWASGSQNPDPGDVDGAGYNYAREGSCSNKSDPRYHARHFGRNWQSTDTPPLPALYSYSLMATHKEHCHDPVPLIDECLGGHHVHSWNDARNQLWADISDQNWIDSANSFSRQVGNEGWYQDQHHDTVFYLKVQLPGGGGGGGR